jgi:histidyl-tRNA synthetase
MSSGRRSFARLPGFRDFPPEELSIRSHCFDAWRRVSRRYGFQEYDASPLEGLELYTEKSGAEIVGQLYNFVDKGDRPVALRPEMTPSLARMLGERSRGMPKPIRWFSIPQLFRYERPQRGRLREHFQWNVDLVGEASEGADAEVLAVALDALRELGLGADAVRARISDRRLLSALLEAVGVEEERRLAAFGVIDKVERESRDRSLARLQEEAGLSRIGGTELLDLLEAPGLDAVRERFGDRDSVGGALERLTTYSAHLEALGLGDFLEFDLRIVRGLAYYTGIVFEVFDRQGELRAVCGGGRYDHLLELVGGEPLPAVGFGMGDVVLTELLRDRGLLPDVSREVDYFLVTVGDESRSEALRLAGRLRAGGARVVYPLRTQPMKKQFSAAASEGAREVVILAPEELARGVVRVRTMGSGEEREVELASFGREGEGSG